jgi:hypothetical protein
MLRCLAPGATAFAAVGLVSALGCAHGSWPDEPGIAVDLVQADNVEAGDTFLAALTARRQSTHQSDPLVAPRFQQDIRPFAAQLQSGALSVAGAEKAVRAWAAAAYGREVSTFALDCSAGAAMPLPSALVEMPSAVISYAAAHFRPRSLAKDQCAILLVALVGSEAIGSIETPR